MTEKKVAFKIELDGIQALRAEMASISAMAKKNTEDWLKWEAKKTQASQREINQREKEYAKMFDEIEKEEQKAVGITAKAEAKKLADTKKSLLAKEKEYMKMFDTLQKIENKEKASYEKHLDDLNRADKKRTTQFEQEQEKRFRALEKELADEEKLNNKSGGNTKRGGFGLGTAGHIAQALGFYRTGHLLRAGSMLNIGSTMGEGGGIGTGTLAAMGAGFAGVVVASKLVTEAFGMIHQTATSVLSAVGQIGGAKGLQEMLVASASDERTAAGIASNSTDGMSARQVLGIMHSSRKGSEWSAGEMGESMRAYISKTGSAKGFGEIGKFAGKFASVSGLGMQETGEFLGGIQTQFNLTPQQVKTAAMNLFQQSRAGTVQMKDSSKISEALGFSRMSGNGNIMAGMGLEMGLVQLAEKGTGKKDPAEAVTAVRRFQEDLVNPKKGAGAALGLHMGTDANGGATFTNLRQVMARASLMELQHPGRLKGLGIDERGIRLPRAIGEFVAQSAEFKGAKTDKEREEVIAKQIDQFSNATGAVENFNKAMAETADTAEYQLKTIFGDLADELEKEFLPIIKAEVIPAVKEFAKYLIDHKTELAGWVERVIAVMSALAQAVPGLVMAVANAIEYIMSLVGGTPSEHVAHAQKSISQGIAFSVDKSLSPRERNAQFLSRITAGQVELAKYAPMAAALTSLRGAGSAFSDSGVGTETGAGGSPFNDKSGALVKILEHNTKAVESNTKALNNSSAPQVHHAGRGL